MKRLGWLGVLLALAGCHPRLNTPAEPIKQVLGIPYNQARRMLLSQGFKTAQYGPSNTLRRRSDMCDDLAGEHCRTFGETWDCKGPGACEFDFVRADHRVLQVITDGDFPPSIGDARWATADDLAVRNISNR